MRTHLMTQAKKPSTALNRDRSGILQRQCKSCGQNTITGGECTECAKKKHGLQRKLTIGASNDPLEQEADRVAAQVLSTSTNPSTSNSPPQIQRYTGHMAGETNTAPDSVDRVLSSPGKPLEPALRQDMEQRFGHDFSRVRVHTDAAAARSASDVNAHAYTVKRNIVFGTGRFTPETHAGRRLLAHELTHVVQQSADSALTLQRATDFGPTNAAPADWKTKVEAAKTSAERAALVQTAIGLTVSDATTASAADASPTAAHLAEYSNSKQIINYDDGLNAKVSPVDKRALTKNAGYTLHASGKSYILLGPKALDADRYYLTLTILNHEFDHVRQELSGSKLKGNESELDAWTSSFIRDFHRTYLLSDTGTTCFIRSINSFELLLDYYHRKDVSDAQRDASVKRITDYYKTTVSGHEGHKLAFKFWIHRSLKQISATPNLAERLNTELKLGINAADDLKTTRQFQCGNLKGLSYPAPTIDKPNFPGATPKPASTMKQSAPSSAASQSQLSTLQQQVNTILEAHNFDLPLVADQQHAFYDNQRMTLDQVTDTVHALLSDTKRSDIGSAVRQAYRDKQVEAEKRRWQFILQALYTPQYTLWSKPSLPANERMQQNLQLSTGINLRSHNVGTRGLEHTFQVNGSFFNLGSGNVDLLQNATVSYQLSYVLPIGHDFRVARSTWASLQGSAFAQLAAGLGTNWENDASGKRQVFIGFLVQPSVGGQVTLSIGKLQVIVQGAVVYSWLSPTTQSDSKSTSNIGLQGGLGLGAAF